MLASQDRNILLEFFDFSFSFLFIISHLLTVMFSGTAFGYCWWGNAFLSNEFIQDFILSLF